MLVYMKSAHFGNAWMLILRLQLPMERVGNAKRSAPNGEHQEHENHWLPDRQIRIQGGLRDPDLAEIR